MSALPIPISALSLWTVPCTLLLRDTAEECFQMPTNFLTIENRAYLVVEDLFPHSLSETIQKLRRVKRPAILELFKVLFFSFSLVLLFTDLHCIFSFRAQVALMAVSLTTPGCSAEPDISSTFWKSPKSSEIFVLFYPELIGFERFIAMRC